MNKTLIVVDDFFDDFEAVRKLALNAEYPPKDMPQEEIDRIAEAMGYPDRVGPAYQGLNSKEAYIIPGAFEKLSQLLEGPIWWPEDLSTGRFRRGFKDDSMKQYIHADNVRWGGIVYLNTKEQCDANPHCGTTLWRHKRTGTEIVDPEKMSAEEIRDIIYNEGMDTSLWEKLIEVPIKPNRLVLFCGQHWHSHTANFGDSIDNCRLIYILLVNEGIRPISF